MPKLLLHDNYVYWYVAKVYNPPCLSCGGRNIDYAENRLTDTYFHAPDCPSEMHKAHLNSPEVKARMENRVVVRGNGRDGAIHHCGDKAEKDVARALATGTWRDLDKVAAILKQMGYDVERAK